MRFFFSFLCAVSLFILSACSSADWEAPKIQEQVQPVQQEEITHLDGAVTEYKLENDLTVLQEPIHSTPIVSLQVWVHVGSKDETDETRGLAHIQEHMLFQGTDQFPSGTIFQTIESVGGDFNAYTNIDRTVYSIILPAESIETGLSILSSMMQSALMSEEDLEKELEVVMEEFRRGEDSPGRVLQEAVFANAFTEHPYTHPVIGYQDTIAETTREEVLSFYSDWYVPENMTLVIVGDIDPAETKQLVQKTFGTLISRDNPKRDIPPEPLQQEPRAVVAHGPFQNTSLMIAFKGLPFAHADTPALDLLHMILGSGRSSRLVRSIFEQQQLVTNISAASYTPEHTGLGIISATLLEENAEAALDAILTEILLLQREFVTAQELAKAKLQLASDFVYQKEGYGGIADTHGFFHMLAGSVDKEREYVQLIESVTKEDIRSVARQYFQKEFLTVGILSPEGEDILSQEQMLQSIDTVFAEAETLTIDESPPERTDDTELNVTKVQFGNGMTLLVRKDESVETLAFRAVFVGGLRSESPQINGVNNLMNQLLTRGTEGSTADDIADRLEGMAAGIAGFSGRNSVGIFGRSLSSDWQDFLGFAAELLMESTYPEDQLELVRDLTLDSIERRNDSSGALAFDTFTALLFDAHPYSMHSIGTPESISTLSRDDILTHAAQYLVPHNLVLSIVGDINVDAVISQIEQTLGQWKPSHTDPIELFPPAAAFPDSAIEKRIPSNKNQSSIILGFPGMTLDDPDRYAFDVLDKILSGAGGRLFKELRDTQSLAYSVSGIRTDGVDPGLYGVMLACDPDKTEAAIAGLQEEIRKIREEPVGSEELQRAIDYLTGTFAIDLQTFSSQANVLGFSERYGLGYGDYASYLENVQTVTAEDVQRLAQEYFTLDQSVLVVVGGD